MVNKLPSLKELYDRGLTFLKDVIGCLPDQQIEDTILYLLFGDHYSEQVFRIYYMYCADSNVYLLLRKFVTTVAMSLNSSMDIFQMRFDVINERNVTTTFYFTARYSISGSNDDLYLNELVIPIYKGMYDSGINKLCNGFKKAVNKCWDEDMLLMYLLKGCKPVFTFPIISTNESFVYIDTGLPPKKTDYLIGCFTTTKSVRFTYLGNEFYIEIIRDGIYSNRYFYLPDVGAAESFLHYAFANGLSIEDSARLTDFLNNKKGCM